MQVYKFGGTSVGGAARMESVASLVLAQGVSPGGLVVVASAMSGVTDALVGACRDAGAGDRLGALARVDSLERRHMEALHALAPAGDEALRHELLGLCAELRELFGASARLGEISARTRDRALATGEKLSVRLLALAMRNAGLDAVALDADTFLETDGNFGEASPMGAMASRRARGALGPLLEAGRLPVVTGFCGQAPDGATTTLGRGGSDLSATVLAAALGAERVTLWSDVDGVFSADPRIVPEARVIPQLHFREAAEMSYYGAKVLHQRTMIPVSSLGIPVVSRNTLRPEAPGTVIDGRFTPGSHPVKAISAVRAHALISVEGKGMAGVPGVAARLFGALAELGLSVTMISQSSSEASICLALPEGDADRAEAALKRRFREELSRGLIEEIAVRRGVALVAAVGLGMAHRPGVAGRVLDALGQTGVNVLAIAQGSSELNISLAVDEAQASAAIRAIHQAFGLHRLDTGEDTAGCLDVMLLGCGGIGRALARLLVDASSGRFERFGLRARVVAVADRSGYLFDPRGLDPARLEALFEAKAAGVGVGQAQGAVAGAGAVEMVRRALSYRLARPVLVDVSDAEDAGAVFLEALARGCDVVTANKKPLAGPWSLHERLRAEASARGRLLKAEATVGAGLPVVDTLEMLMATGDRLRRAEGCLSGTLGFVTSRLEDGATLSQAVTEAWDAGYTEPDPVVDLSGADVGRKAVILGRYARLLGPDAPVEVEGLVDPSWAGLGREALLERLRGLDEVFARRIEAAAQAGKVLRYVARVSPQGASVGPVEVPRDSPVGRLRGTDNLILFASERYDARPLVVTGPGAGVEVTAMGVLGDILRVAAQRRL